MKTITLEVDDALADKLNKISKDKRDLLLKIWMERATASSSLSDLLEFTAMQAKQQGLTDEKLNELLNEK